jgi:hypothetical protein
MSPESSTPIREMRLGSRMTHRFLSVLVMAGLAAGCSSGSTSDYAQLLQIARNIGSLNSKDVTLEEARNVPFASIGVRVGDGSEIMLVLISQTGSDLTWTSAS